LTVTVSGPVPAPELVTVIAIAGVSSEKVRVPKSAGSGLKAMLAAGLAARQTYVEKDVFCGAEEVAH
jgi:hypothetical protein